MHHVRAVIVVGLGEVAELVEQRGLARVQPDQAVSHMRLQRLDAQQLVGVRLDTSGRYRDAARCAALHQLRL